MNKSNGDSLKSSFQLDEPATRIRNGMYVSRSLAIIIMIFFITILLTVGLLAGLLGKRTSTETYYYVPEEKTSAIPIIPTSKTTSLSTVDFSSTVSTEIPMSTTTTLTSTTTTTTSGNIPTTTTTTEPETIESFITNEIVVEIY